MKYTYTLRAMLTLLSVLTLLLGLHVFLQLPAEPASAQSVSAYQTIQLVAANAVTQTVTPSAVLLQGYGVADCYGKAQSPVSQTVTFGLWHGPNTTDFTSLYTYTAQAVSNTTAIVFTSTALYGNYLKANVTLAGAVTTTYSIVCVAKNRAQ